MISIRGGWRVAALLAVFLAGTVSGADAASKPLMTRLMQDPPSAPPPPPEPPAANPDVQAVADSVFRGLAPGGGPQTADVYRFIENTQGRHTTDYSEYWSAQSSDTSVVTARVARAPDFDGPRRCRPCDELHVWIRPVGTGQATITVGYTEGGTSVSASFTVTVADPGPDGDGDDAPGFPPHVRSTDPQEIADTYLSGLQPGENPARIPATWLIIANPHVAEYSRYWSARSSDTSVLTVALGRGNEPVEPPSRPVLYLWVWPVGNGEATITLAYARHGESVTVEVTVRVGADGQPGADGVPAPVVNVQAVVNEEVVDQAGGLEPGGRSVAIDVNDLFVNVGGATGRDFSATSSDGRVVVVEVTDNPHVVIRPVGEGVSTVTVRYTAGGRSVRATFGVAVGEDFVPPVPALPLAAAGLLAALLFGAGLQRRRRSR